MSLVRFNIRAELDPNTLPRLLNYFAQLGQSPKRVVADIDSDIRLVVDVAGLPPRQFQIIAEKMRSSLLVTSVDLSSIVEPVLLPLSNKNEE